MSQPTTQTINRSQTYRLAATFPIERGEEIIIRDGKGRAVERWTARSVDAGKVTTYVMFDQSGYRSAEAL